jgi:hypothetical protein
MNNLESKHYSALVDQLLFERLDHPYVLGVDDDRKGCTLLVEHYDYKLSPALVHIRW